jgi:serine/threonine protein kinase
MEPLLSHFTVAVTAGAATPNQSATLVLERGGARYFGKVVKPSECASQLEYMRRLWASLEGSEAQRHFARPVGLFEWLGRAVVVTELVDGVDMHDYVTAHGAWSRGEEELRALVAMLLRALEAMHDRGVVHGDVKPENIMLQLDARGRVARACLVDFGFCFEVLAPARPEVRGSVGYSSPEVLLGLPSRFSPLVDVWGLGATLLVLVTATNPFLCVSRGEVDERASRAVVVERHPLGGAFVRRFVEACSPGLRAYIGQLLLPQHLRPTVAAALAHPWLAPPLARPCTCAVPCAVPMPAAPTTGTSGTCDSAAATA